MLLSQVQIERFWAKVEKTDTCWFWTAAVDDDGYGRFANLRTHQIAYILTIGPIPAGKELNHTCQHRSCVNPDHLEALTHTEHMRKTPGTYGYKWAHRTHCLKGHPLTEDNLVPFLRKKGQRRCRQCAIEKDRQWRQENPEKFKAAVARYREKMRAAA